MKITAFIKRNRVKLLMGLIVLCTALGAALIGTTDQDRQTASAESINYSISGTWTWHDTLTGSSLIEYEINFTIFDGYLGTKIKYSPTLKQLSYTNNENQERVVSQDGKWSENAKTIDFGDTPIIVSSEFYNFLTNNATKNIEYTISGTWTLKESGEI